MGPPSVALVGGPDEIIEAIFDYRRTGVTQFLFQGRPDLETMIFFGREILPRIRRREESERAAGGADRGPGADPAAGPDEFKVPGTSQVGTASEAGGHA